MSADTSVSAHFYFKGVFANARIWVRHFEGIPKTCFRLKKIASSQKRSLTALTNSSGAYFRFACMHGSELAVSANIIYLYGQRANFFSEITF